MKRIFFLFCIVQFSSSINAYTNDERILDYHSRIDVLEDGDIYVTETIKVLVTNNRIRHGIYRSTPTIYFGMFFSHKNSDITILSTKLDGYEVENHQENLLNGIRVYLGSKDKYVSKGIHTYQIIYSASQQVIDYEASNGIYWNVTGTDWAFPIDKARADIYLPTLETAKFLKQDAWTGYQGSQGRNYKISVHDDHLSYETTKNLMPKQGLTIKASWPLGLITNPQNKTWFFIKNNIYWFASILMLLLFPLYFYKSWKKVGIDPPKGAIFPRFYPPKDISPAAIRFINKNRYESKVFSVAIMSLAVKNYIKINSMPKKAFLLIKTDDNNTKKQKLSAGEHRVFDKLFKYTSSIKIEREYDGTIYNANKALERRLIHEHKEACFKDNFKYWFVGVGISLFVLLLNWLHFFNFSGYAQHLFYAPAAIIIGSSFCVYHAKSLIIKLLSIVIPIIITIVIFSDEFERIDTAYRAIIIFIISLNALFYYLIQAPTVFGRKILDQIAGFKLYLATAEQDRLDLLNPPEMTPELFEEYLPYALALGVENRWSERFHKAMEKTGKVQEYHANWYIGSNYSHTNFSSVATAVGAGLASTVASATTVPSSSGNSSGGGGGGGGGGW